MMLRGAHLVPLLLSSSFYHYQIHLDSDLAHYFCSVSESSNLTPQFCPSMGVLELGSSRTTLRSESLH